MFCNEQSRTIKFDAAVYLGIVGNHLKSLKYNRLTNEDFSKPFPTVLAILKLNFF